MALAKKPVHATVTVTGTSQTLETLLSSAGVTIGSQVKGVRFVADSNGIYMKIDTATTSAEPIQTTHYNYTGDPAFWKDLAFVTAGGSISMFVELQELA